MDKSLSANEVIKKYDIFIKGFARKYCRYPEDEEDFAQELRIKLWQAYEQNYDPAKGKLPTWIYQTLRMWSRRFRFDMRKQAIFDKGMLNSSFYHEQHYIKDSYFIYIAELFNAQRADSENKYPEFEHEILISLTPIEFKMYNLLLYQYPKIKIAHIAKDLKLKKEEAEKIHIQVKEKVLKAYHKIYCI